MQYLVRECHRLVQPAFARCSSMFRTSPSVPFPGDALLEEGVVAWVRHTPFHRDGQPLAVQRP
jgi:hypothetical protein